MTLLDIDVSNYDTIFLDRDGVINILRPNDYVKKWSEFEFLPNVLLALAKWNKTIKKYNCCYKPKRSWKENNDRRRT